MAYTGYKIQPTLKKVTDDVNEYPLDINNQLCSISGLPQDTMPNPEFDPTYRVEDDACDPILYESRAMTEYFMKDCGDDEYSNNVPFSTTLAQFTSYISQEDADNQAWAWLMENGQANADSVGTCSTTYCNEPETRVFFSTTCSGYPEPYYVTIPANTFCDTDSDVVIADVDSWFATNGQSQADINGTCKTGDTPSIFYKVTGDPCTSERTAIKVYYKNSEDKYYTDEAMTVLANFYFFLTDSTLGAFKRIINGVLSPDLEYPQCEAPIVPFNYDDMGTPADIAICGDNLLACYPDKHIVVLYDKSTGTNPVGTIVAGRLNVPATWEELAPDSDAGLLNNPMMVEWVADGPFTAGNKFVVYSGGSIKSLKCFVHDGTLIGTTNYTGSYPDGEWRYKNDTGLEPNDSGSLVGMMTPYDSSLTDFWTPVSMSAAVSTLGDGSESGSNVGITVFLGLWSKAGDINKYKIYTTTLYNFDVSPAAGYTYSRTQLLHNNTGYSTGGNDLIRDMDILRSDYNTDISATTHRLIIATPYAQAKSKAKDKNRFYNLHYLDVEITRGIEDGIAVTIGTHTNIGDFRTNTSTNGIWKNNLKAEINVSCGVLYVYIKSSNDSIWNILLRTAALPTAAGLVGTAAALSLQAILGWFTCAPCLILHGAAGPATILIGAIIGSALLLAVLLFSPPPQRYLGGSAITFTFSGDTVNITGSTYTSGSYKSQSWITNSIDKARTLYMNNCDCDNGFYSMSDGRKVKYGTWNANNASSTIVN